MLAWEELRMQLQAEPFRLHVYQGGQVLVFGVPFRRPLSGRRPAAGLEHGPSFACMLRTNQEVYVPHRPVGERGVRCVGQRAALEEHHLDPARGECPHGFAQALLQPQRIELGHHRELAPRSRDLERQTVRPDALQPLPHDERRPLGSRQGAERAPVEFRRQQSA